MSEEERNKRREESIQRTIIIVSAVLAAVMLVGWYHDSWKTTYLDVSVSASAPPKAAMEKDASGETSGNAEEKENNEESTDSAWAVEPSAPDISENSLLSSETGEREVLVEKSIDINSADAEELDKLPGIGPVLAGRIIEYREENGGFADIEELLFVEGIGEKTLEKLRDFIVAQ